MKHYITICLCFVLSAALLFTNTAEAASISLSAQAPSSVNATLINQYVTPYDSTDNPIGSKAIYTYHTQFNVGLSGCSTDSYNNGFFTLHVIPTISAPTGTTLSTVNASFTSNGSNEAVLITSTSYTSGNSIYLNIFAIFDNYFAHSSALPLGVVDIEFTCTKAITTSNDPDPASYVSVSTGCTAGTQSMAARPNPDSNGLCAVITQAINNGSLSTDIDSMLTVLQAIQSQDSTAYTNILTGINSTNQWLDFIFTWLQQDLQNEIDTNQAYYQDQLYYLIQLLTAIGNQTTQDYTYYVLFRTALNAANDKLQTLIDLQNDAQDEQENMETAAEALQSKANAVNDYQQPNVNYMLTQADTIMVTGNAGVNLIATIINQPLFVTILLTVVSLGFVGYLLYGKGV